MQLQNSPGEWIATRWPLLLAVLLGVLVAGAVVPYFRATARRECEAAYAQARSGGDTLRIDQELKAEWRFPGLRMRCEAVRLADQPQDRPRQ
jgi:hypothetical protein